MISRRGALGAALLGLLGATVTAMVGGCRGRTPDTPAGGVQRVVESYGSAPVQEGEWFLPPTGTALPVVVLVHGGFWQPGYDRHLEDDVAAMLAADGFAVWNIDYRLADEPWPATLLDAAAAMDHLKVSSHSVRLNLERIAVVGHSAGGHLALWLASRGELPADAPGGGPAVRVKVAVGQAPVADLVSAAREKVGGSAVPDLVDGDPDQLADRYSVASPQALLPIRDVQITLVHGDADDRVPLRQSTAYVEAARVLGMTVGLRVLENVGHFEHLEPDSAAVTAMRTALDDL